MNTHQETTEAFDIDEFETVDATESTQGAAGGAFLEMRAWVYRR
jgi:hypothetical protein